MHAGGFVSRKIWVEFVSPVIRSFRTGNAVVDVLHQHTRFKGA